MSFFLVKDKDAFAGDFGTGKGLVEFGKWAESQGGEIAQFIEKGYTDEPQKLADELEKAPAQGDNESMRSDLLIAARGANDYLILTDGANNEDDIDAGP